MQRWILDATSPTTSTFSAISWLPYVIAGVAILALIYLYLENRKLRTGKEHYKERAHKFNIELQQKANIIINLTSQKDKLEKELADSELDRKSLEDRLKSLEMKKVPLKAAPPPAASQSVAPTVTAPAVTAKQAPKPVAQPSKPPVAKVKYARYADMGDGFSNAELLDKPDSETIFELTISANNTGEYKVASIPEAQRYALSNAQYFLGKTCQYDSFPSGSNATIK